jgi:hypothetical protein
MKYIFQTLLIAAVSILATGGATVQSAPPADRPGTEEFGMSMKELVQAVEKTEALIAKCMHEQGFEYVAADFKTIRRGMVSDKSLPGMDEEEFAQQYGFGISTLYTGLAPQLVNGYSPGRIGLGEKNVEIFKRLSPADQAAYNRALFGENVDATFAVSLEAENFARCGGCTLKAVQQVFKPDQLKSTYYNPKDALINKDPRMKAAIREYATQMRAAGFDYNHPDEVEPDIQQRLAQITGGTPIPVEKMSPEQQAGLKKLQEYERRVGPLSVKLQAKIFEPVEEKIEKELYARPVQ